MDLSSPLPRQTGAVEYIKTTIKKCLLKTYYRLLQLDNIFSGVNKAIRKTLVLTMGSINAGHKANRKRPGCTPAHPGLHF